MTTKLWAQSRRNLILRIFGVGTLAAAGAAISTAQTGAPPAATAAAARCQLRLDLAPNQTSTVAATVVNEYALWTSQGLNFAGRVATDDGSNTFADVWVLHTDALRWGVNESLPGSARGPVFNVSERESFWGKGQAEIRVRTRNSPTHVCLCTARDANKLPVERCLNSLAGHFP
jgi:hypothetical protein